MSTVLLTDTGDFDVSSGNLSIVTDPAQALAIKLRARFRLHLGDWFLDTRIGVPYRAVVLVKNPNIPVIRQMLRNVAATTPGVRSVDAFTLNYDPRARTLAYSFRVTTDKGAIITGGEGAPFIVTTPSVSS